MAKQRLIVLFDGTWNDYEDRTNVWRLATLLHDYDDDIRQRFFYDPGLGTSKWDRFMGGAFGYGLRKNLMEGYRWLAEKYVEGDEIWIFGFSRGAYTARSLVGLIRKCGLVHIHTPRLIKKAEQLYRDKSETPDGPECKEFKKLYSHEPDIHFLGVWDTVGALGIPIPQLKQYFAWHDTELSKIVKNAYQAMALDEHRKIYNVSLWTSPDGKKKKANDNVEQRWFIGVHANVGGGYPSDSLADLSLEWMLNHARQQGLSVAPFKCAANAWQAEPVDSFENFLMGGYAWYRRLRYKDDARFIRRFNSNAEGAKAVNVSVDDSVWSRWQDKGYNYRPQVLVEADIKPDSAVRKSRKTAKTV